MFIIVIITVLLKKFHSFRILGTSPIIISRLP